MKEIKLFFQTLAVLIVSTAALAVLIACVRIAIYLSSGITGFVTGGFGL